MCIGMCVGHKRVYLWTYGVDMCGVYVWACVWDLCLGVCVDLCMGICTDMRVDMCTGMCTGYGHTKRMSVHMCVQASVRMPTYCPVLTTRPYSDAVVCRFAVVPGSPPSKGTRA